MTEQHTVYQESSSLFYHYQIKPVRKTTCENIPEKLMDEWECDRNDDTLG